MARATANVGVILLMFVSLSEVANGATIKTVEPAYPVVVNGSLFTVRVTVVGAYATGSHYVNVALKGASGFTVKTGTQSISHLSSGAVKSFDFQVQAPSYSATGSLTVQSKWSTNYSGSGTYMTDQKMQMITCNAGWKVSVQLLNPGGLVAAKPTVWSLVNSWRYTSVMQSSQPPYYVTFTVPATPASYTIGGTWWLLNPIGKEPIPKGGSKTIYISKSGTVLNF